MKRICTLLIIGLALAAMPPPLPAAQQIINVGTTANDGSGDSLRAAFGKVNNNNTELYTALATSAGLRAILGDETGTGALVFQGGALGAATATSLNGLTITTSTGTVTIANGKTATVSNTLTFAGTDGSTVNFGAGGTVLYSGGTLGVATATSLNGLTITTSSGTLTIANGKTATVSNTLTFTGTDSSTVNFGAGGTVLYSGGALGVATATSLNGLTITTSSGTLTIANGKTATVSNTLTFTGTDSSSVAFGGGGTVVYTSTSQTLTNKTISGADNTLTVRLANDVTGTLPIANGGTAATTAGAARDNLGIVDRVLEADENRTSDTALTDLTGLSMEVTAGSKWLIYCQAVAVSSGGGGASISIAGASPSLTGLTSAEIYGPSQKARYFDQGLTIQANQNDTVGVLLSVQAYVTFGTSGTATMQAGQYSSDATPTMFRAGQTFMRAVRQY